MKLSNFFYAFAALTTMLISCKKELSEENDGLPPALETQWSFTQGDSSYGGPMDSARHYKGVGVEEMFISGETEDGKGEIILQLIGSQLIPGTYSNPQVLFQYSENNIPLLQNVPANSNEFSIVIESIDSISVTGTFTGKVEDNLGNEKMITNGKFTTPLIDVVDEPQPVRYGELTVWSKSLCENGGDIQISVAGQTGAINQAYAEEPFCGSSGTANFNLPVGTYNVVAVCGVDSATFQATITENNCTLLDIDFDNPPVVGDYFPLSLGSEWVYQSLAGEVTVESSSDAVFENKEYRQFNSSAGSENYYRKDLNTYYEYITLDFGGAVTGPPSLEFPFLKDNIATGGSWETPEYNLLLSGLNIRAKLRATIINKNFSETLAGILRNDLIEVLTELLVFDAIGNVYETRSSYTAIYAKGIGKVYYSDPDDGTEWFLKNHTINP